MKLTLCFVHRSIPIEITIEAGYPAEMAKQLDVKLLGGLIDQAKLFVDKYLTGRTDDVKI